MAECTAHNGFVVGSIPTKPNTFYIFMKFELKSYKVLKIKYYLKQNNFFFFFAIASLNLKNWVLIEQALKKSNLKYYRLINTITKKLLKKSIYKNYCLIINSLTMFVNSKQITTELKNWINLENFLSLLCVKLNNKMYSVAQLKTLNSLDYKINISLFFQSLILQLMFCFRAFIVSKP